jgi:hypothetical protein
VRTKVLIDLDIDLLPILIRRGADKRILAGIRASSPILNGIPSIEMPKPSESARVETIARRLEVVGSWHFLQDLGEIAQRGCRGGGA